MVNMTLAIDKATKEKISAIKKKASENVTPIEVMMKLQETGGPAPGGLNKDYTLYIPNNYCATYTHEEQPGGIVCKHLSVSVSKPGALPHPMAVQILMLEFDFENPLSDAIVWKEKFGDDIQFDINGNKYGSQVAINIVEPLSGNLDDLRRKETDDDQDVGT